MDLDFFRTRYHLAEYLFHAPMNAKKSREGMVSMFTTVCKIFPSTAQRYYESFISTSYHRWSPRAWYTIRCEYAVWKNTQQLLKKRLKHTKDDNGDVLGD